MTWRHYLQIRTRTPAWLWRMAIGILLAGVVAGVVVDYFVPAWIASDAAQEPAEPEPLDPDAGRLDRLADEGRWLDLWLAIPGQMAGSWRQWGATTLAVLTGFSWLAFVMQAIQVRHRRDDRLWMPLVGLALGVLSVWPTLFLIYYQERVWGLEQSAEVTGLVRFFILGVGLREELSKFVCFLPLLPLIVRQRDELAALLVAGAVGLGFAMEENVLYIIGSGGTGALSRLLVPAPFHMAMTGLLGLAAYRACVWPRQWGPQLVAMFGVIVLAHGLYDTLLSLPQWPDLAFFSQLIFIFAVYQFFHEMRPNQQLRVEPISLTANFLACVSTVAAATFIYLSAGMGWRPAIDVLAAGILGQGVMVYLFLREMPEKLVTV